jgi:two-component system cell cycle response regulator DivK
MDKRVIAKQKKYIMVVDDSEDMRYLIGRLLEKAGYGVIFAENGETSLIQAKLYHPVLILMDLSLPDLSGWEAVASLRKMSEFRSTPIIAVTGHISSIEVEHAKAVGCSAHIGKPFDPAVLLRSIARLLNSH